MDNIKLEYEEANIKEQMGNIFKFQRDIVNKINIIDFIVDKFHYLFDDKIVGEPYYNGALDMGNAILDCLENKGSAEDVAKILDSSIEELQNKMYIDSRASEIREVA